MRHAVEIDGPLLLVGPLCGNVALPVDRLKARTRSGEEGIVAHSLVGEELVGTIEHGNETVRRGDLRRTRRCGG